MVKEKQISFSDEIAENLEKQFVCSIISLEDIINAILYETQSAENMKMGKSFMNFIYGAGEYGKLLFQWLLEMGIRIDYFVQTDETIKR